MTLGLDDHVILTGARRDVPDLLPAFDVFALSSRFEGLPIALLEAMASGVACVATTVGGVTEVLTDGGDGLLVGPGDPSALAAAIVALLGDPDRRDELGRVAIHRAAQFELTAAVRRIERVYAEVLRPC
jgi:glycosyltransferase involved in cell wall biosynthesis